MIVVVFSGFDLCLITRLLAQVSHKDSELNFKQRGFVSFGTMTLLVGGTALGGLLLYGAKSGHELPLWPAILVALVNLAAAGKLVLETREKKRLQQAAMEKQADETPPRRRK